MMDADLSHPPDRINDLLAPLFAGSCRFGSREPICERRIHTRLAASGGRVVSRAGAALAYPLTGLHDSMCGFFAIGRSAAAGLGTANQRFQNCLRDDGARPAARCAYAKFRSSFVNAYAGNRKCRSALPCDFSSAGCTRCSSISSGADLAARKQAKPG